MHPSRASAFLRPLAFSILCALLCAAALASDFSRKGPVLESDDDDEPPRRAQSGAPSTAAPAPVPLGAVPEKPPQFPATERPLAAGAQVYTALLYQRRFDEIDRAADDARARNATLSDGQPLLGAIYDGVQGCMCAAWAPPAAWAQRRALLDEWRRRNPRSVTAEVAAIGYHMAYAWNVRAQGGKSPEEQRRAMDAFAREAGIAYGMLEAAGPAARADAGAYYLRLQIGLALGWPKNAYAAIYTEGTSKYPLYLPLHFAAANYYDERWYGSAAEDRQFREDAVAATRARLGETLYARLHWSRGSDEAAFRNKELDWDRMKAGFERITTDYPDAWNLNHYLRYACIAGDNDAILKLAPRITKPSAEAWKSAPWPMDACVKVARLGAKK